MKKIIIQILFLFLFFNISQAQNLRDVVHLKNGSIVKGRITEQTPGDNLKIQTADGSVFVYSFDEVEKITTEAIAPKPAYVITPSEPVPPPPPPPDMTNYKYNVGIGVALGGGGIVGIPIRIGFTRKFIFELGIYERPQYFWIKETEYDRYGYEIGEKSTFNYSFPPMISGGIDFYFSENYKHSKKRQFKSEKNMIIRNGITFKIGKTLSDDLGETLIMAGWSVENFKAERKNKSLIIQIGPGFVMYDKTINWMSTSLKTKGMPMIFWKVNWNWGIL